MVTQGGDSPVGVSGHSSFLSSWRWALHGPGKKTTMHFPGMPFPHVPFKCSVLMRTDSILVQWKSYLVPALVLGSPQDPWPKGEVVSEA